MRSRFAVLAWLGAACLCAALIAGCGGGGEDREPFNLAGTVKNEASAPIPGATVTATLSGDTEPVATTTTTSTGVFSFSLPAAIYVVEATAAGYVGQQKTVDITGGPDLAVAFVLSPVGEPPPEPTNLAGVVLGKPALLPVGNATVTATILGEAAPVATTTTATDGSYGFVLDWGHTYVIAVTASGYDPAEQSVLLQFGLPNLAVNFTLDPT